MSATPELATLRIVPPQGWIDIDWRELWAARELLYFFVWRDVKIRYKQTAIGAAWAVLQPVMTMLVFSLFFGLKIPSNGLPYPVFYYSALLPWMYFANALQSGTNVVVEQQRVITKVYFPRLVLPLSAVGSGLLDFAISFAVFLVMMVYYRITPGPAMLFLPFFLLLAVLTALGVGLWLSALNAIYRDVRYVVPFPGAVLDVCFSGGLSQQPGSRTLALDLRSQPMAGVIDGFRWSLTGKESRRIFCWQFRPWLPCCWLQAESPTSPRWKEPSQMWCSHGRRSHSRREPGKALSHRRARTLCRAA